MNSHFTEISLDDVVTMLAYIGSQTEMGFRNIEDIVKDAFALVLNLDTPFDINDLWEQVKDRAEVLQT